MEVNEFDFNFPRGDTCPYYFDLTDNDGNEVDLSESELYFTFKRNSKTQNYLFQKRLSRGEIVQDGTTIMLVISHEDTARLSYGDYFYDIQLKSGDYVKTLYKGIVTLDEEGTWIDNE